MRLRDLVGGAVLLAGVVLSATAGVASAGELPDGFVYLRDVEPTIKQDMRYYGDFNFLGVRVRGYEAPECVLTSKAASALKKAQSLLRPKGLSLKVYDCYRPAQAVAHFVAWAKDPSTVKMKKIFYPDIDKSQLFARKFIATKSKHSRGSTVDVTVVPADAEEGLAPDRGAPMVPCDAAKSKRLDENPLDLGTNFDCFSALSETRSSAIPAEAQRNRKILLDAMAAAGFENYHREWWHFELIDEPFKSKAFDFPIRPRKSAALPQDAEAKTEEDNGALDKVRSEAEPGSAIVASAVEIVVDSGQTRFSLSLSSKASFTTTAMAEPYRIVVELPDVHFKLEDGAGNRGKGLIERFRFGASGPGKTRIVLELKGPARIERVAMVPRNSGAPVAFELRLVETDARSFAEAAAAVTPGEDVFPILTPPKPGDIDECKIRQLVVLDPGHGGIDSGAVSPKGTNEKDLVLAFAKVLRDKLKATKRFRVMMTRDTDVFIPLKGRVNFATSNRACLFLSLHADSADDRRYYAVRGGTVYTRSDRATDEESARTALKENAADEAAGMSVPSDDLDPVSSILEEKWGDETAELNFWLADILVPSLKHATRMTGEPHRQAAFYVLKSPLTPSALIELGFISNKEDEKELQSETWRDRVADGIVAAIDRFFKERRERLPIPGAWLPAEN